MNIEEVIMQNHYGNYKIYCQKLDIIPVDYNTFVDDCNNNEEEIYMTTYANYLAYLDYQDKQKSEYEAEQLEMQRRIN